MDRKIPFNRSAINATACISGGWELIKDNYGLFLGISLLAIVITGCVPCVSLFFIGPIMVGIYHCLFTRMRGEHVEFNMMFKGFDKFVPAMAIGLIQAIPSIIGTIVNYGIRFSSALIDKKGRRGAYDFFAASDSVASWNDLAPFLVGGMLIVVIIVAVVAIIFSFAWHISLMFALPLLADNDDLTVMECLKNSFRAGWANPGGIILLMILEGLLGLLGLIAICVGFFLVIPILHAANAVAFRFVFPERPRSPQASQYNEPPRPEYYGGSFGNA